MSIANIYNQKKKHTPSLQIISSATNPSIFYILSHFLYVFASKALL